MDRASVMTTAGEFRTDRIPVGNVRKAMQMTPGLNLTVEMITIFCENGVHDRATVDVIIFVSLYILVCFRVDV